MHFSSFDVRSRCKLLSLSPDEAKRRDFKHLTFYTYTKFLTRETLYILSLIVLYLSGYRFCDLGFCSTLTARDINKTKTAAKGNIPITQP